MGMKIRTIGLANIAFNMRRLNFHERTATTTASALPGASTQGSERKAQKAVKSPTMGQSPLLM